MGTRLHKTPFYNCARAHSLLFCLATNFSDAPFNMVLRVSWQRVLPGDDVRIARDVHAGLAV